MLHYIDFKPDVIHTNDWHTGMLGAYLKEDFMQDPFYQGMKNIYTIHNLKYQGVFGREIVEDVLGMPLRLLYNGNIENAGSGQLLFLRKLAAPAFILAVCLCFAPFSHQMFLL